MQAGPPLVAPQAPPLLRTEQERLLEENLELLDALSQSQRGRALLAPGPPGAVAARIAEVLCLETGAHCGAVWLRSEPDAPLARHAASHGGPGPGPETLDLADPPEPLAALGRAGVRSFPHPETGDIVEVLWLPLRHGARLLGAVCLSERVGGFGPRERAAAERLAGFAGVSSANALKLAALERLAFRDPTTGAYTRVLLEDATRAEIHRSGRSGRSFSLVRLRLEPLAPLRKRFSDAELGAWLARAVADLRGALRSSDLVAAESESHYCVLAPETPALGAAAVKRRLRAALLEGQAFAQLAREDRPRALLASATWPEDGADFESLDRALDTALAAEHRSLVHALELEDESFAGCVDALLERARPAPVDAGAGLMRFLLSELARGGRAPGICYLAPGGSLGSAVHDGLAQLPDGRGGIEVVLLDDAAGRELPGVTRLSPRQAGTLVPFAVYFGGGPAWAMVCDRAEEAAPRLFHTNDRTLVEHLAFQLQRELDAARAA